MATKKSKAQAAAAKAAGTSTSTEAPAEVWTAKKVELLIAAFNDSKLVPAHDEDGLHGLVDHYYGFVDVVARGDVDVDALPLATELLRMGHAWLEAHPKFIRINSPVWTQPLVEDTVRWFAAVQHDESQLKETMARFAAFERVWRSGFVEDGEPRLIAQAFVEHVRQWLLEHPAAQKAYDAV